ncbi:MAG: aromatic-ring-hydroxylating dioxygenase subunit beta [Rhodospirillales bacterium]|jgi:3-phenylpropionate/cinnamic acid dioxygenase small subunit
MADASLSAEVARFLYGEALMLDERRWDDWLALYAEDAVFWVPSYTMRGAPVSDPELSINLIYITSRAGLEDRIFRIRTGTSEASAQLPRTCHQISNVTAEAGDDGVVTARANFMVASWSHWRGQEFRSGRYEYQLAREGEAFLIGHKKVLPIEEVTDGWFDVVSI